MMNGIFKEVAEEVGKVCLKKMEEAYNKLTDDEREQITGDYRLAKILLLATYIETIDNQFNAEGIRNDLARVKRILKKRY